MKAYRAPRPTDAIALGSPALAVADEDREQVEDLLAELLVAELERDVETK